MDVRDCRTVHRLPSSISRRFAERRPGSIGHITLRGKCAGARSAGKPHAACDVAGAGNGLTVRLVRHSHRKRGETDRPRLRSTAPALDPTALVEDDHVVETLTSNGADYPFDKWILPRGARCGKDLLDPETVNATIEVRSVGLVSVPYQVPRRRVPWKSIDHLLHRPLASCPKMRTEPQSRILEALSKFAETS